MPRLTVHEFPISSFHKPAHSRAQQIDKLRPGIELFVNAYLFHLARI